MLISSTHFFLRATECTKKGKVCFGPRCHLPDCATESNAIQLKEIYDNNWDSPRSFLCPPVHLVETVRSDQTANKAFMPTHAHQWRHNTSWTLGNFRQSAAAVTSWDIRLVPGEQVETGASFTPRHYILSMNSCDNDVQRVPLWHHTGAADLDLLTNESIKEEKVSSSISPKRQEYIFRSTQNIETLQVLMHARLS